MGTGEAVVGGILLLGGAWEAYALMNKRPGDTFSEVTRKAFQTKRSRAGRLAFGTTWVAFAVWFWGHILFEWPFPGFE